MTDLQPAFQELLVSPARLALCMQASSGEQLLGMLKQWWHGGHMSDQDMIAELNVCNRQVLAPDSDLFSRHWMPYRYHPQNREISWCLPQGRATAPFFDQFIAACRQRMINQFFKPRTALAYVSDMTRSVNPGSPCGFIFHVSRCGSTLVSGCLAEFERASVLSESPLLTEILLDPGLGTEEQRQFLPILIGLQGNRAPVAAPVVVKWNAWDLFHWPLIRALYPRVPVLLLFRDPVEILASHRHQAGRHMAGDPALAGLNPVFAGMSPDEDFLDFRIRILYSLLTAARDICTERAVMAVDYAQLDAEKIRAISRHFGIVAGDGEYARIQRRMRLHSKELNQNFRPDSLQKQQCFDVEERARIKRDLTPLYQQLLSFTQEQPEAVAC